MSESPSQPAPEPVAPVEAPIAPVEAHRIPEHVEAVLISVERPISPARLAQALGLTSEQAVQEAIGHLNDFYDQQGRAFRIESVAGGFQIQTRGQFGDVLARLHRSREEQKLSPAALETLAIIAYKQPIVRSEIEAIRGVASGEVIRSLMDKRMVKIVGRAEELGRPMLYGTTRTFLEVFGLGNLKDLPKPEELAKK